MGPKGSLQNWLTVVLVVVCLAAGAAVYIFPSGAGISKKAAAVKPVTGPAPVSVTASTTRPEPDAFADLRLERERGRSRREDLFRRIVSDPSTQNDLKTAAQQELWRITRLAALEDELEGVLRAQGYPQVVVLLGDNDATVMVRSKRLEASDVSTIAGMVSRMAGVPQESIRVYERGEPG